MDRSLLAKSRRAFTLIELLVVVVIVGILAALLLPALTRAKQKAQGVACLSNLKQCALAWTMYAADNRDFFVPNWVARTDASGRPQRSWCDGTMSYGSPAGTNAAYLMSGEQASLGPYVGSVKVFKCPADRSTTLLEKRRYPRVRSYSINICVGTDTLAPALAPTFQRPSDLGRVALTTQDLFVFADEHADTILVNSFSLGAEIGASFWGNRPSSRHGGAGVFTFMDGRSEMHRWTRKDTSPPETGVTMYSEITIKSLDWLWVLERMTKLRPGHGDW